VLKTLGFGRCFNVSMYLQVIEWSNINREEFESQARIVDKKKKETNGPIYELFSPIFSLENLS